MAIQSVGMASPYLNYKGLDSQSKDQVPRDQSTEMPEDPVVKKQKAKEAEAVSGKSVKGSGKEKETPEELAAIRQLVNAEKKVVAHEQAHMSVGGQYAGAASYGYTNGPDGKRYITSGEVPISVPSTDDPEKMLVALKQVVKAALAPADPSPQDIKVAQSANAKLLSVNAEISVKKASKAYGGKGTSGNGGNTQSTFEING